MCRENTTFPRTLGVGMLKFLSLGGVPNFLVGCTMSWNGGAKFSVTWGMSKHKKTHVVMTTDQKEWKCTL